MNRTSQSPFYDRSLSYETLGGMQIITNPRLRANEPTLVPLAGRWAWYISD